LRGPITFNEQALLQSIRAFGLVTQMVRLNIDLPEDVKARLDALAARTGHASLEEFVQALLRTEAQVEDAAEDYGAPSHLSYQTDQELEAKLLERLGDVSSGVEVTAQFWDDFRQRVEERRRMRA
jgi:predicted DNA-binding protein